MKLKHIGPNQWQIVRVGPATEGYSHSGEVETPVADLSDADLQGFLTSVKDVDAADGSVTALMHPKAGV